MRPHFRDVGVTGGFDRRHDLCLDVRPIAGLAGEFVSSDHHCAIMATAYHAPLDNSDCQRVGSASNPTLWQSMLTLLVHELFKKPSCRQGPVARSS